MGSVWVESVVGGVGVGRVSGGWGQLPIIGVRVLLTWPLPE